MAGRNEEKLKKTLQEIGEKSGKDLSNTPIIIADVNDEGSLKSMAERAKVVVICCICFVVQWLIFLCDFIFVRLSSIVVDHTVFMAKQLSKLG